LVTACASEPTSQSPPVKPVEPSWHWEWASTRPGGSSEQFSRDRYACRQDYNPAAAPPFIHRYPDLELQWMDQHEELCLQGKGWKKVQNALTRPARELKEQRPSRGMTPPVETKTGPSWIWLGPPEDQVALEERLKLDREKCIRKHGIVDPHNALPEQLEGVMECMSSKKWEAQPSSTP
jgi:hypothetical protein